MLTNWSHRPGLEPDKVSNPGPAPVTMSAGCVGGRLQSRKSAGQGGYNHEPADQLVDGACVDAVGNPTGFDLRTFSTVEAETERVTAVPHT